MAWLFFVLGAAINLQAFRKGRRGIPLLPGVVGSLAAFFTVAVVHPPWPWLWIVMPLFLDVNCVPRFVLVLWQRRK
jgi:hypothetical protein